MSTLFSAGAFGCSAREWFFPSSVALLFLLEPDVPASELHHCVHPRQTGMHPAAVSSLDLLQSQVGVDDCGLARVQAVVDPVSYTHLDVYKRQSYDRCPRAG